MDACLGHIGLLCSRIMQLDYAMYAENGDFLSCLLAWGGGGALVGLPLF